MKQKEPARMTAAQARVDIWEKLRKVARPDSRFSWEFSEFITDYEGSDKCAELLTATQMYKDAKVIFITPDNNLEKFREQAFLDKNCRHDKLRHYQRILPDPSGHDPGRERRARVASGRCSQILETSHAGAAEAGSRTH